MIAAVYTVSYRLRRKGATNRFEDLKKEIPIDDEIFKKNYIFLLAILPQTPNQENW